MMLRFPTGGWPKPMRGDAATGPIVAKRSLLRLKVAVGKIGRSFGNFFLRFCYMENDLDAKK